MYNKTRTVPSCKSNKNLEILGQTFLIVIHSHIYPFLICSNLPYNFLQPTDFDQILKIFSDILKNDVRFTDIWLKCMRDRKAERIQNTAWMRKTYYSICAGARWYVPHFFVWNNNFLLLEQELRSDMWPGLEVSRCRKNWRYLCRCLKYTVLRLWIIKQNILSRCSKKTFISFPFNIHTVCVLCMQVTLNDKT